MRRCAACLLALLVAPAESGRVLAATAYVTDQLILGVYAQQNQGGERLATLHSGANVETLASSGDYTQVRTVDGVTGWVKSTFLVSREPAAARVKELEDELNRTRATTPALAEAAAHSEAERLQQALASSQAEVAALRASMPPAKAVPSRAAALAALTRETWRYALAAVPALGLGFWWGYSSLARRIRKKFGGIKVY